MGKYLGGLFVTIVVMLVLLVPDIVFQSSLSQKVYAAKEAVYIDEFSSHLRVATFYMEKNDRTKGTCAPAYNELRQIFYDSGELTPLSPIQEFQDLKIRLEHWKLPPMFCGE